MTFEEKSLGLATISHQNALLFFAHICKERKKAANFLAICKQSSLEFKNKLTLLFVASTLHSNLSNLASMSIFKDQSLFFFSHRNSFSLNSKSPLTPLILSSKLPMVLLTTSKKSLFTWLKLFKSFLMQSNSESQWLSLSSVSFSRFSLDLSSKLMAFVFASTWFESESS